MVNMRRKHNAGLKAKVALDAVKGEKTIAQIASEYGVHPNMIRRWRKHLLEALPELFSDRRRRGDKDRDELEAELYRQIGQLKVELDWLKKNYSCSIRAKERDCGTGKSSDRCFQARDLQHRPGCSVYQ